MSEQPQVLCIVNTKRHAVDLFKRLSPAGEAFHLSTNMCPRHRSAVLRLVKRRLKTDRPCRLVSTSLIEAGVDIDFPVVYRAMAGIDAIAQAAGRCNREGKNKTGRVYVFEPDAEHPTPPGYLRQTADTAHELVGLCGDLLAPESVERYFKLHYWKKQAGWDRKEVMKCFRPDSRELLCDFRTAAERFQMIPEQTHAVIIPYGRQGRRCIARLKAAGHSDREQLRRLQRYTAQVSEGLFKQLQSQGLIEWLYEQIPVLLENDAYHRDIGLSPGDGSMIL